MSQFQSHDVWLEWRMDMIRNTVKLNVTDGDVTRLTDYLNSFQYINYGNEMQPDEYFSKKPCTYAIKKRKDRRGITIDGIRIERPHIAAFVLEFRRYPKPDYCVSHLCGKTDSRCTEYTHLEVVLQKVNNQRQKCHHQIDDGVITMQNNGVAVEKRNGTIFCSSCAHEPTCFKQKGKID